MIWLCFSCHLLIVGGSCGFLPWRGVVFCRNNDEREDNSGSIRYIDHRVTEGLKYAFEEEHPVQKQNLLATTATVEPEKMLQPEIRYLVREVGDNSHNSFGYIHGEQGLDKRIL